MKTQFELKMEEGIVLFNGQEFAIESETHPPALRKELARRGLAPADESMFREETSHIVSSAGALTGRKLEEFNAAYDRCDDSHLFL